MARRHAIGNGYHIPSIMVLLALLINPIGRVGTEKVLPDWLLPPQPRGKVADAWEARHATGTLWAQEWASQQETKSTQWP